MTPYSTILLIHDNPIAGEVIQSVLRARKPLYRVVLTDNPEKAITHLKNEPVHLVIANLRGAAPEHSLAFLAMLNGWNPPIPIITVDETVPEDAPLLAAGITVLPPPLDFDVLLELIDTMTLAAQESVLNGISLRVFLQMLELERKTCTLRVLSGYQMGYLHLREGRLISARTGQLRNQEAVFAILDWPNCTITVSESAGVAPTMDATIQSLLMEWCIDRDERPAEPAAALQAGKTN